MAGHRGQGNLSSDAWAGGPCISFLCCITNRHKLRSLKQHEFIISKVSGGQQSGRTGVGFSAQGLTGLNSRC